MSFDPKFIESVKEANPLEDVVSEYTKLRSVSNKIMKGCCPFHDDPKPSFAVYTDTQSFFCFGCGAGSGGSDVISFVRQIKNMSFDEAVTYLADRCGLKYDENNTSKAFYDDLYNKTRTYFKELSKSDEALAYLKNRGINDKSIIDFRLGYCNDPIDSLYGRIIFPILDIHKRTTGFAGRTLKEADGKDKYLNNSNNEIFKKGDNLYGIHLARNAIQEKDKVYIVEGYTDVILLHQNNITNTVCLMGTSFTDQQIKLVKRYTDNVVLVLDGDTAGKEATLKHIKKLQEQSLSVSVIPLPPKTDPAELALSLNSPEELMEWLTNNEISGARFQINEILNPVSLKIEETKSKAMAKILPVLKLANPIEADSLVRYVSATLGISRRVIEKALYKENDV